jgi:hypothetical protein
MHAILLRMIIGAAVTAILYNTVLAGPSFMPVQLVQDSIEDRSAH